MPKDAPVPTLSRKENELSSLPREGEDMEGGAAKLQLNRLAAAGCHKLDFDVEILRDTVDKAGFAMMEADLKGVKGKKNLLIALAQASGFTDEFGANWDAMVDVFCDLSWHGAPGYVLLLHNISPSFGLSSNDREIMQDIFDDTVLYWRQRNKPFWIFFA